ncbi:MAG: DNA ligase D [Gammaproteobacteria bacterium]
MSLRDYTRKRRFEKTPEPSADAAVHARAGLPTFVIQLHHARARHYDFRLEVDGVLKSWAIPKGPSLRAGEKRLAVEVEDHPLSYGRFEGEIPEGNYGAGHVQIFDEGRWAPDDEPLEAIAAGKLDFTLYGGKLHGRWKLIRTRKSGRSPQWLLIKRDDGGARDAEADDLIDSPPRALAAKPAAGRKAPALWRNRALKLDGARRRTIAADLEPQLCSVAERPPTGDAWLHEVKWDGYRMLADLADGVPTLRSRNGLDWSGRHPSIEHALAALPVKNASFDGELVAVDARGHSDFNALQCALEAGDGTALQYVLFDLRSMEGVDLTDAPLIQRKALLAQLLENDATGTLVYSSHIVGHGAEAFGASAEHGFEGIISKRADAKYEAARSRSWLKIKHITTDEFIVVGYTLPQKSRTGFGALLLARIVDGALVYAGRVGTGFDDAALRALHRRMHAAAREDAQVAVPTHTKLPARTIQWTAAELVVEVAFRGLGKEGLLRHPSFVRLRDDKSPADLGLNIGRDVVISSPERVVYSKRGYTKQDVADYYREIAPLLLTELRDRPLSLLRCPGGVDGECFFQKHHAASLGPHVRVVPVAEKGGGRAEYLYVSDVAGVLELVQMNVVEFHTWGARVDDPERPDRLVFDLDPGNDVAWGDVKSAARDVRDKLAGAGLKSWVRLTGGKGLHVVVPIARGPSWDDVKAFCGAFAGALAEHEPLRYVSVAAKKKRGGKIFVDWLRNGRGATSVCSWSLRARDGATVAVPLRWDELGRIRRPDTYDLRSALRRAAALDADPWADVTECRQKLP